MKIHDQIIPNAFIFFLANFMNSSERDVFVCDTLYLLIWRLTLGPLNRYDLEIYLISAEMLQKMFLLFKTIAKQTKNIFSQKIWKLSYKMIINLICYFYIDQNYFCLIKKSFSYDIWWVKFLSINTQYDIFYQRFGWPKAIFGPLARRQPHSHDIKHCTITTQRSPWTS